MKRIILLIAVVTATTSVKLCAQFDAAIEEGKRQQMLSPTEKRFNSLSYNDIRDYLYLNNGKVIFEVRDVNDYKSLEGLDTILQHLQEDIGFYRDSLDNGSGNVRIDYAVKPGKEQREIRFIKFPQRGESFVISNKDTERLKIERDTIRIIVRDVPHKKPTLNSKIKGRDTTIIVPSSTWIYDVQVTLLLNNYTDIGKIIAQKDVLRQAMDTFVTARSKRETNMPYAYPSSCIFRPYNKSPMIPEMRFVKFPYRLEDEHGQFREYNPSRHKFAFYANMGMGVVRNTLAPSADAGITFLKHMRNSNTDYYFTSLYISPTFFFERDANREFFVHDNWFVNIVSGNSFDKEILGLHLRGISLGAGYLAIQNGDYFKGTTIKVFSGLRLMSGLTLYPEVLATNNFKQIFPGMTLKVFGFKRES